MAENDKIVESKLLYKSARYVLFSYAKMVNRPVSIDELGDMFPGLFVARSRKSHIRSAMRRSVQEGLVKRIDENTWVITPRGKAEIPNIIDRFRESRERTLGQAYMDRARKELHEASRVAQPVPLDQRDREDEILDRIDRDYTTKMKQRSRRNMQRREEREAADGKSKRLTKSQKK